MQWQLPIYQLGARHGAFEEQLAGQLPSLVRNWYVGIDPGPKSSPDPIPAAGFKVVSAEEEGASGILTERELDRDRDRTQPDGRIDLGGEVPRPAPPCFAHMPGSMVGLPGGLLV